MPKPVLAVPLLALVLAAGGAAPAAAQTCGEEVARLAQQYNLSTDLPSAGSSTMPATPESPSAATRTERLAQSGGVLSPPDVGAPMAIQPPAADRTPMPTAPPVTPSPPAAGADAGGLTAAQRSQMESLLQAARAAARQGKDEQCAERLRDASAIPGRGTTRQ